MAMSEAATVDAANATGAETRPPVAESFGSWMDDFELNNAATEGTSVTTAAPTKEGAGEKPDVAAASEATVDPEKPADAATVAADPAAEQQVEAKPASEQVAAKPAVEDDPELTPEDNAIVKAAAPAEQPELKRKFKAARFEDHFLSPDKPKEEVRQYLQTKSPSHYADFELAVIDHRMADLPAFADELYERSPETYGKLALEVFKGAPEYFAQQITGRSDATPETIKTALSFHEAHKDRVTELSASTELTPKQLERIETVRLYDGEDAAQELEADLKAAKSPAIADVDPEKEELKAKVAELEGLKTKEQQLTEQQRREQEAEQQKALKLEVDQTWDAASSQIENYLDEWANDPKDGLGLAVTPQERELAPRVAVLKDLKRAVLFDGLGDLPDFRKGLTEWGKTRETFNEKLKQAVHFADLREKDNAIAAAQGLIPFVEKYKQERLKSPVFTLLDELIDIAAAASNPKTESETFIPGAPGASSQHEPSSDPNRRLDDMLYQDALT